MRRNRQRSDVGTPRPVLRGPSRLTTGVLSWEELQKPCDRVRDAELTEGVRHQGEDGEEPRLRREECDDGLQGEERLEKTSAKLATTSRRDLEAMGC